MRSGIDELLDHIVAEVKKLPKIESHERTDSLEHAVDKNHFQITKNDDGTFTVSGALVDNLIRGVVLSDTESRGYFHRRLQKSGVIRALRAAGMSDGDTVKIANTEFTWTD
jgi:GTP-binding protein